MNNWRICWFFTYIFTGVLIFKELTAQSFGVKGLIPRWHINGRNVSKFLYIFNVTVNTNSRNCRIFYDFLATFYFLQYFDVT
jgi:hypothetical protein